MNTKRYALLDILRGITLISMIVYHTIWDMVYIFDVDWLWFESPAAYVWQQSICWCFILLSGFCWSLGKHKLKRGLTVFIAGALVSIVTLIVIPEESKGKFEKHITHFTEGYKRQLLFRDIPGHLNPSP